MAARALIIEARFYDDIADMLQAGARAEFERRRFSVEVIKVPGVLEIAPALSMAIHASRRRDLSFDAFVVMGCVMRGETGHYDVVAGDGNRAVMDLAVSARLAIGNAILTVENMEQAVVRADPKQLNKGGEAALAALTLFDIRNALS